MRLAKLVQVWWWLVLRELLVELRVRRAWAAMLVLGLVLVLLVEMQLDLPAAQKQRVVSILLWLDVFFAGILALDRSFTGECEEGCWRALLLYPVAPTLVFLAKVAVLVLALSLLECVLLPALVVFANVPLLDRPLAMALLALLANVGFASIAVVAGAASASLPHKGSLLTLLVLPLTTPVLLGVSEATRLLMLGEWNNLGWRWLQFLAAIAVLFTTLGTLVFEWVVEE
jgi:heme exporter protein B